MNLECDGEKMLQNIKEGEEHAYKYKISYREL